jgi:hypothetical protein
VQHAGMVEFLRQGRHDQDRRQRPRFGRDRHQGEEAAGIHPCRVAAKAVSLLGGVAVAGGAAGPAGGEPWPSLRCPLVAGKELGVAQQKVMAACPLEGLVGHP